MNIKLTPAQRRVLIDAALYYEHMLEGEVDAYDSVDDKRKLALLRRALAAL